MTTSSTTARDAPVHPLPAADAVPASEVAQLRSAIREGQLVVHYHPVIDLVAGCVVGVEALVRWDHPQRGLLPPSEFVPLAESAGLIEELGTWVLRAAAGQAAIWEARRRPLDVSINLSPRQMVGRGFADCVAEVLREVGAPVGRIILEVTESAVMDQPSAVATLEALHDSGIRLALDDFGTGYASMSYLRQFPVDAIKIDRSFVSGLGRHPDDDAIVGAIVDLARNTGKAVVAEGVETAKQLDLLRSLGVRHAQGYYWTPPLPVDELEAWADAFARAQALPMTTARTLGVPRWIGPPRPGSAEEKIMRMHSAGASEHTIAAALNSESRRRTNGVRWHVRSVGRVIGSQPVAAAYDVSGEARLTVPWMHVTEPERRSAPEGRS